MSGNTPSIPVRRCSDLLLAIVMLGNIVDRHAAVALARPSRTALDQDPRIQCLDRSGFEAAATKLRPGAESLWPTPQARRCAADKRRSRRRAVVHFSAYRRLRARQP